MYIYIYIHNTSATKRLEDRPDGAGRRLAHIYIYIYIYDNKNSNSNSNDDSIDNSIHNFILPRRDPRACSAWISGAGAILAIIYPPLK